LTRSVLFHQYGSELMRINAWTELDFRCDDLKNFLFLFTNMISQRHINVQNELERRFLNGLSCEWDLAWQELNTAYQTELHKPLFSLQDMTGKWGYWSGEKREICLSRYFVTNHSWAAVREVLLHEMAHQFAEEILGATGEPPHGPSFKKACYLLRANPKASGRYRPLDERILDDSSGREDKILIRVKKLMALAQSENQHEAEAAMAKAYQLIKKYNIDLIENERNRDFVSIFVGEPALRHFREHYHLSSLLQDFYFVYGIWVPAYVMDKGKRGSVLEISGTVQNVRIASYVHDFVRHFIDSQWRTYTKDKRLNRYRKTDFAMGIIGGFRSKLELQTEKEIKGTFEIVKTDDPQLKKYTAYKYPRASSVRGKALKNDENILIDGIRIGTELVISKGIEEKARKRKLLLRIKNS